jgi:hypothetical protein
LGRKEEPGEPEKHGLSFEDADLVFRSLEKITAETTRPGMSERRWTDVADVFGRVLILVYTRRGRAIRVISFRPANRRERRKYHGTLENR